MFWYLKLDILGPIYISATYKRGDGWRVLRACHSLDSSILVPKARYFSTKLYLCVEYLSDCFQEISEGLGGVLVGLGGGVTLLGGGGAPLGL